MIPVYTTILALLAGLLERLLYKPSSTSKSYDKTYYVDGYHRYYDRKILRHLKRIV